MTAQEIIDDLKDLVSSDDYGSLHSETIKAAVKAIEAMEKTGETIDRWLDDTSYEDDSYICEIVQIVGKYRNHIRGIENGW